MVQSGVARAGVFAAHHAGGLTLRSFTARLRVAWIDTDTSGRIHYTAAMRYFEQAEHALMREAYAVVDEPRMNLPRVHVEADYKAELRFEDEVDCTVRVASVGRSSITYEYSVCRLDGAEAVAGRIVAVAIGGDGRPTEISAAWRAALEAD